MIETDKVCDFASHIFLKSLSTKQRQEIAVSLWEQVEETLHILVEKNFGMEEIVELLRIYGIQCLSERTDHFIKSCGHWLCTVRRLG